MVTERGPSTWTKWTVMGQRSDSLTAIILKLKCTTASIMKMLGFTVNVR